MAGRRWLWAWALTTPGRGSSGCCWSVGASVLAVLAASCVGAAPRHSWQRVPLVLLMVRVMDVRVLLMPMVLQVLYRVMPRVRALWLVLLQFAGGVAGDASVVRVLSGMLQVVLLRRLHCWWCCC